MLMSMTAYARSEKTAQQVKASTEIRSYNSRYLDVVVRLTPGYQDLEERVKGLVAQRVDRGRVEVRIQIVDESKESHIFEINEPKAQAYYQALEQLRGRLKIDTPITLELLINAGIIAPGEAARNIEGFWPMIRDCLDDTLTDLVEMRGREGEFIARDIAGRLERIAELIDQIKSESAGLLTYYQARLKERIAALTKGIVEIDPARVAQEAAFWADKSDIAEEIVRTESHLQHFRQIMGSMEPAGRKLTFLLQELGREFNTMGSKTEKAHVSHMIVEVKSELEKIREQVQNIE